MSYHLNMDADSDQEKRVTKILLVMFLLTTITTTALYITMIVFLAKAVYKTRKDGEQFEIFVSLLSQVCVQLFVQSLILLTGLFGVPRKSYITSAILGFVTIGLGGWLLGILSFWNIALACGILNIIEGAFLVIYAIYLVMRSD